MNENGKQQRKENALLDIVKFLAAILICASHCLPIFGNAEIDYYYGQWFFRFCVPLFLISAGFFFSRMEPKRQVRYLERIAILYAVSCLLYYAVSVIWKIPYILHDGPLWKNLLFGYGHLWYLPALLFACAVYIAAERFLPRRVIFFAAVALFAFGVFFDEYYKLFRSPVLNSIAKFIDNYLGQTRNGIFFAFPMLCLGARTNSRIPLRGDTPRKKILPLLAALAAAFALAFLESRFFHKTLPSYVVISFDLSVFNWMPAFILFLICMSSDIRLPTLLCRSLRKGADVIYIVHFAVVIVLGERYRQWGMSAFLSAALISTLIAAVYAGIRLFLLPAILKAKK